MDYFVNVGHDRFADLKITLGDLRGLGMDYKNKNIVVVGLGKTGLSCVDYFLKQGVHPRVVDSRPTPPGYDQLHSNIETHFGYLPELWLMTADLIVVSPGIALSTPMLKKAAAAGVEIVGDIELFCREINRCSGKRLVAITGANGKTTVTSLLGSIAKAAGIATAVGGNIGCPVLSLLNETADLYVMELSSFQLETTTSLRATIATILNISEDHMDRYPQGLAQYTEAKQRVYRQAKYAIVNEDDPLTFPKNLTQEKIVTYGRSHGEYCLDHNYTHLMAYGKVVLATKTMKLNGIHNYTNALVALAAADILGIERMVSTNVIKAFVGLPHRFELVHQHQGIRWINDSKATNVGSTHAALGSVVCDGHLYLLLGGDGKCADFTPLLPSLARKNLTIYTFGQDAQLLAQLKPDITCQVNTLREAVQDLAPRLKSGDVVLLSPACASLDQFKNYEERGEVFRQLAEEFGT